MDLYDSQYNVSRTPIAQSKPYSSLLINYYSIGSFAKNIIESPNVPDLNHSFINQSDQLYFARFSRSETLIQFLFLAPELLVFPVLERVEVAILPLLSRFVSLSQPFGVIAAIL